MAVWWLDSSAARDGSVNFAVCFMLVVSYTLGEILLSMIALFTMQCNFIAYAYYSRCRLSVRCIFDSCPILKCL